MGDENRQVKKGRRRLTRPACRNPNKNSDQEQESPEENPSPPCPENIITSPLDPSEYRHLILQNGLKVLLISTLKQDIPAADEGINPKTGAFYAVENFNREYLDIDSDHPNEGGDGNSKCKSTYEPPETKRSKKEDCGDEDSEENEPNPHKGQGMAIMGITIGAGSFHDPKDFPGMAHFLEHVCLIYGSRKYPAHSTIFKYMANIFADCNAVTYGEMTTYFFQVDLGLVGEARFRLGVDMFADAISAPLLPAEAIKREIYALDSEFSLSSANDTMRCIGLYHHMTKEDHPQGFFDCGISETLRKDNLHPTLVEWKNRHYSANNMSVVLKASISLDDLEEIVEESFGSIPSFLPGDPSPTSKLVQKFGNPFDDDFNRMYKVVPAHDFQGAEIRWEMPLEFIQDLKTKPLLYLQRYFIDEGEGSLAHFLKSKLWISAMGSDYQLPCQSGDAMFRSIFSIWLELTDRGMKAFDEILLAVYSYIEMMASEKPDERLFRQIQLEYADRFHYDGERCMRSLCGIVETSTNLLLTTKPKYVLTSMALVTEFNTKVLQDCVDRLIPENMNLVIFSKSFEKECKNVDRWYQTKFCSCDFSADFIQECKRVKVYEEFTHERSANPYRVENLTYSLLTTRADPTPRNLLQNRKACVVYVKYNHCPIGRIPQGHYTISLSSPLITRNAMGRVLLDIWSSMLFFKMTEVFEPARFSGVKYDFNHVGDHFLIDLKGPAYHLSTITKQLLDIFVEFDENIDEQTFQEFRKVYIMKLSDLTLDSINQAKHLLNFFQAQDTISTEEALQSAQYATLKDFKTLVRAYKEQMYIFVSLIGFISEVNAKDLSDYVDKMRYRELPEEFVRNVDSYALQVPLGERCLRVKSRMPCDPTSAIVNHYQFMDLDDDHVALLEKLVFLMGIPLFTQLRTTEQLSYCPSVMYFNSDSVDGLTISVVPQCNRFTPGYVDQRIEEFLVKFRMTLDSYEDIFPIPEDPQTIDLDFPLLQMSQEQHQALLEMYDEFLLPSGKNYRKVSIQVLGHVNNKKSKVTDELPNRIQDKIARYPAISVTFTPPSKPLLDYQIPACVCEDNGYFVTNVKTFRNSLCPILP